MSVIAVDGGLPGVLWRRAAASPAQLAVIENDRGRWQVTTARQLADSVAALAVALAGRGVRDGARVGLLVANRAAWLELDLAVQAAGGVSVAVPANDDDEALASMLEGLGLLVLVVEDIVALMRVKGLVDAERIDPVAELVLLGTSDEQAEGTDELVEIGRQLMLAEPTRFEALLAGRAAGDPATVTLTAGAGGRPRPIVHTVGDVLGAARQVASARALGPGDVGVVAFPPAHPFERSVTIYPAVVSGAVLAFPENRSTLERAMLEVQPTFAHLPVDHVRAVASGVRARFARNRGVKRLAGRSWSRAVRQRRAPSVFARRAIGRPVLRTLGWVRLRSLLVTAIEVPADTAAAIGALGLEVESGYAVVEAGGLIAIRARDRRFAALDGTTISSSGGILCVSGPGTGGAVVDTGDVGRVDAAGFGVDGPTASDIQLGSSSLLGASLERELRESPYVALARVSARDGAPHAAIEIDRAACGAWAAAHGLHFTTFASLVGLDEVGTLIAGEVARLAPSVVSHDLLHQPLQQGRDITRTRTTVHRRLNPDGADPAPAAHAETASALE